MSRMVNRPDTYLGGLGARMAIARNELGLSQARMAEALGISQRAYQSYETGKRSIPVEALVDMHRQFGVDLNWILLGVEAVRPGHDLAALERFETALDRHLGATGIRLKSEKRGAIVARWYRSFLEGKEIPMDDVHTWIELLRE
jgi:transcriptional regulator with XRE-family HTH domain